MMEHSGPKRNGTQKKPPELDLYEPFRGKPQHTIGEPITNVGGKHFNRQKCIAVDVDDTLIIGGKVNTDLVAWCKEQQAKGFFMILWSARGVNNAKLAAKRSGIQFDAIIPKPGHIVDDLGWSWTDYTQEIDFQ